MKRDEIIVKSFMKNPKRSLIFFFLVNALNDKL